MEYFIFINLLLFSLFIFYTFLFFIIFNSSLLFSSIYSNNIYIESLITFISLLYIILIISPGLLLFLDLDLISSSSYLIYILGYQWAWSYNLYFPFSLNSPISFDQLLLSSSLFSLSSLILPFSSPFSSFSSSLIYLLSLPLHYSAPSFTSPTSHLLVICTTPGFVLSSSFFITLSSFAFAFFTPFYLIPLLLFTSSYYPIFLSYSAIAIFCSSFLHSSLSSITHPLYLSCFSLKITSSSYFSFYMCLFNHYLLLPLFSYLRFYISSFDVIHSFGLHSFGFKSDAIPGRLNFLSNIIFFSLGSYLSYCYELCGLAHTSMLLSISLLSSFFISPLSPFSSLSFSSSYISHSRLMLLSFSSFCQVHNFSIFSSDSYFLGYILMTYSHNIVVLLSSILHVSYCFIHSFLFSPYSNNYSVLFVLPAAANNN